MLRRRSAKTVGYQAELDAVRPVVEARSQGWCEVRLPGCTGEAAHIHHRKLRKHGGGNSADNLLSACLTCHDTLHRNPAASYEAGFLVRSTADPAEVPVIPGGALPVRGPIRPVTELDLDVIKAQHPGTPHFCHICDEYRCEDYSQTPPSPCPTALLVAEVERLRNALKTARAARWSGREAR